MIGWFIIVLYALLQLWRVLKGFDEMLNTINRHLPGIITNIEETIILINRTTKDALQKVETLLMGVQVLKSLLPIRGIFSKSLLGMPLAVINQLTTLKALWKSLCVFFNEYNAKK